MLSQVWMNIFREFRLKVRTLMKIGGKLILTLPENWLKKFQLKVWFPKIAGLAKQIQIYKNSKFSLAPRKQANLYAANWPMCLKMANGMMWSVLSLPKVTLSKYTVKIVNTA